MTATQEEAPHQYVSDEPSNQTRLALCTLCKKPYNSMVHVAFNTQNLAKSFASKLKLEPKLPQETIAEEASRIVYGDREKAYDDPNQNFRRLAFMIQGVLDKKLLPGVTITPNDAALILVCLKIAREAFKPSRENRVDGIGYWLCLDRIVGAEEKNDVVE